MREYGSNIEDSEENVDDILDYIKDQAVCLQSWAYRLTHLMAEMSDEEKLARRSDLNAAAVPVAHVRIKLWEADK